MVRLPRVAVGLLFCSCMFAAAAPARAPNPAATGEAGAAVPAKAAPPPESVKPSKEEVRLYPIPSHGKYGYIDRSGKVVVEPQFIAAGDFHEGRAWVKAAGADAAAAGESRYGYIDATGKIVIAPRFLFASDFSEGVALVTLKDDHPPYWMQNSGPPTQAQPPKETERTPLKTALVDVTGKQLDDVSLGIVPKGWTPSYLQFSGGLVRVSHRHILEPSTLSLLSQSRTVLECVMANALNPDPTSEKAFWQGAFVETKWGGGEGPPGGGGKTARRAPVGPINGGGWDGNGIWGFLDKKGKVTIPPQFSQEREFHEGLAAVRVPMQLAASITRMEPGLWGFIDTSAKLVIEPQFEDAVDFSEGMAFVRLAETKGETHSPSVWVVINRSGAIVLKTDYAGRKRPGNFRDGLAPLPGQAADENSWRYIDRTGKGLSISDPSGMRLEGKDVVSAGEFRGGLARIAWRAARSGDSSADAAKVAYIDTTGKIVWHE